jgi:hypothetical protein
VLCNSEPHLVPFKQRGALLRPLPPTTRSYLGRLSIQTPLSAAMPGSNLFVSLFHSQLEVYGNLPRLERSSESSSSARLSFPTHPAPRTYIAHPPSATWGMVDVSSISLPSNTKCTHARFRPWKWRGVSVQLRGIGRWSAIHCSFHHQCGGPGCNYFSTVALSALNE